MERQRKKVRNLVLFVNMNNYQFVSVLFIRYYVEFCTVFYCANLRSITLPIQFPRITLEECLLCVY